MDLATDANETMLFAATESGPFVYLLSLEKWFSMAGSVAPLQRYWSVEYLPLQNRVRFATYGRGIWDFEIEESVSAENHTLADKKESLPIWPNPSNRGEIVRIDPKPFVNGQALAILYTLEGVKIWSSDLLVNQGSLSTLTLPSDLLPQSYILAIRQGTHCSGTKLLIMN